MTGGWRRLAAGLALWAGLGGTVAAAEDDYEVSSAQDRVSFVKPDGSATVSLAVVTPDLPTATTKIYAQRLLDTYQGWDLQPVLAVRGFTFKYVDNGPCAGLVSYFDGASYLFFQSCGLMPVSELTGLYRRAGEILRLPEILHNRARPDAY